MFYVKIIKTKIPPQKKYFCKKNQQWGIANGHGNLAWEELRFYVDSASLDAGKPAADCTFTSTVSWPEI